MKAGEFKAQCLKVMDRVKQTRKSVIITKRNVPVAKLVPLDEEKDLSIVGLLEGTVQFEGDIIKPIEEHWDACNS